MSIQKIILEFEPKPENILPVVKKLSKSNQYLGKNECEKIAEYFSQPVARIFSVASFFDLVKTKKETKKIIKVCSGGPCICEKSIEIARQLELLLKIELGSDAHPKYKLEFMSCAGLCDQGPVVMIGDNIFEKIRPETIDDIILNYL